jgi:hypothetical protein
MAEGRVKEAWTRESAFMAMFANANRDQKKKSTPFVPSDFNPFAQTAHKPKFAAKDRVSVKALKCFLRGKPKNGTGPGRRNKDVAAVAPVNGDGGLRGQ